MRIIYFWRNRHIVFHSSCTILHSHQLCGRAPVSPYPCHRLLFSGFLMVAVLIGVRWSLMVFVCTPLVFSSIELLFMHLLAIGLSALDRCLIRFFAHFLITLFACFWILGILYTSFLSLNHILFYELPHFIYLFSSGWRFGWFPLLAIMNVYLVLVCCVFWK